MTRIIRLFIAAAFLLPAALAAQTAVVNIASVNRAPAAPPTTLDSAISRLQDFLNRYPASPLRPNALLQLGELLVRQADTVFAQSQRSAGVAVARVDTARAPAAATPTSSGSPIAPDYSAAIARSSSIGIQTSSRSTPPRTHSARCTRPNNGGPTPRACSSASRR